MSIAAHDDDAVRQRAYATLSRSHLVFENLHLKLKQALEASQTRTQAQQTDAGPSQAVVQAPQVPQEPQTPTPQRSLIIPLGFDGRCGSLTDSCKVSDMFLKGPVRNKSADYNNIVVGNTDVPAHGALRRNFIYRYIVSTLHLPADG